MKNFANKDIIIPGMDNRPEIKTTYFGLAKQCINNTPPGGYSPEEMRKRLSLEMVVHKAEEEKKDVEMEIADLSTLKNCVKIMTWGVLDKQILDFVDYVESL